MSPQGVMPHPWWQFWQIGDFLIMLAVVVFFVRFMRRSDARTRSEDAPPREEERHPEEDSDTGAAREPDGTPGGDRHP